MARRARVLAAALAALVVPLGGCYEAPFPLSAETEAPPVDPRLVGHWRCVSPQEDAAEPMALTISRADERRDGATFAPERRYAATFAMKGEETLQFRGHATRLAGQTVVNVQDTAVKPGAKAGWNVVRPTLLKPDILVLEILQDDFFKGVPSTAEAARALIEGQSGKAELFGHYCVCSRVASKAATPR